MLGCTVVGESVSPAWIGSSAAIVNGVFIVGGVLEGVPDDPALDDYRGALWLKPVVLVLGALSALSLRECRTTSTTSPVAAPANGKAHRAEVVRPRLNGALRPVRPSSERSPWGAVQV
jgi:hypothetical protein